MKIPSNYRRPVLFAVIFHVILLCVLIINFAPRLFRMPPASSSLPTIHAAAISESAVQAEVRQAKQQPDVQQQVQKAVEQEKQAQLQKQVAIEKQAKAAQQEKMAAQKAAAQKQLALLQLKQAQKQTAEKKLAALKAAQDKAKAEKLKQEKLAALKAAQAKAEKLKQQKLAQEKADKLKLQKVAQEKANKLKQQKLAALKKQMAKENALIAEQKKLQQQMMQQQINSEAKNISSVQSQATQGAIDKYKAQILATIQQNWRIDQVNSKLKCEYSVQLAPDGTVLSIQLVKSSGDDALDQSAKQAITLASPLPVPHDPALFDHFRQLLLTLSPQGILQSVGSA